MNGTIFDITPIAWVLSLLCGILVGFTKTGVPGIGILAVPLMAHIFPAGPSTGIFLPMLITGDIFAVAYYHHHADWKYVLKPMGWAAAGIILAFGVIKCLALSDHQLRIMIAVIVLFVLSLGLYLKNSRHLLHVPHTWWFAALVGLMGGFTTMTSNAAGPIWIVYLLSLRFPKQAFMGTNAWIFLILNTFKVPFSYGLGFITSASLLFNVCMIPAIAIGAYIGIRVIKVIPQKTFEWAATILAAAAALKLLF